MTAEYVHPPREKSELPGRPVPFFLTKGAGDRAVLFDQLFTVLLSGEETDGQFGVFTMEASTGRAIPAHAHAAVHEIFYVITGRLNVWISDGDGNVLNEMLGEGDFGYVPAGLMHSFRVEADGTRVFGVSTGGFERFFETAGKPTSATKLERPFIPDQAQLMAAAQKFNQTFDFGLRFGE